MLCQELNSFLSYEAWCLYVNCAAWVYLRCDNFCEDIVKVNVASSCLLVDCCQFRNVSIDFVIYITAFKSNLKIIIFTKYLLFTVFCLLPASSCSSLSWEDEDLYELLIWNFHRLDMFARLVTSKILARTPHEKLHNRLLINGNIQIIY